MDENNRNFILAILLSIGVLFAWQVLFVPTTPQHRPGKRRRPRSSRSAGDAAQPQAEARPKAARRSRARPAIALTRDEALAKSPRIAIDTPSLKGSIALKGGRIDDLTLKDYRETVEPTSPQVVLLSPAGGPHAYYAESGFVGGTGRRRPCAARRRHAVDGRERGDAHAGLTGHAHLRQRQGAEIHPHDRDRRQIHVHDRRQGGQYRRPRRSRSILTRSSPVTRRLTSRASTFCTKA